MQKKIIWLRAETKLHERRTPLTPEDAAKIIACNHQVTVERSKKRIFKDTEYLDIGCILVEAGSWHRAPLDAYILGIKELPTSTQPLHHRHIYFAHAYKNQEGAHALLNRFIAGKGLLYDLEFLQNENKHRVTCFSYWAGVAGCAVTLLLWIQKHRQSDLRFKVPEFYPNESMLVEALDEGLGQILKPSSLVIGARGRCARGVIYFLKKLNLDRTLWYRRDTQGATSYPEIFQHDLLFNCIYLTEEIVPFITEDQIDTNQRLSIVADISCDPNGPYNPLPIYEEITTFQNPVVKAGNTQNNIDVMAIDHLPSFLPRESSSDFSEQLTPYLMQLLNDGAESDVWKRAASFYYEKTNAFTGSISN